MGWEGLGFDLHAAVCDRPEKHEYDANMCFTEYIKDWDDMRIIKEKKEKLIRDLLEKYKDAPEQGTEAWKKVREGSVGGSEISIITGDNPYKNLPQFIKERCGLTKSGYSDNMYTRWGSIFEDVIQNLTELLLNCKVSNVGSIDGVIERHRYSLDGLTTVGLKWRNQNEQKGANKIKELSTWKKILELAENTKIGKERGINEYIPDIAFNMDILFETIKSLIDYLSNETISLQIINFLLEFKCPLNSVPNGSVPQLYYPQVKAGLCDLKGICDTGLFINASFRKCSYRHWKFSKDYDEDYHQADVKGKYKEDVKKYFNLPIALGAICVYISLDDLNNEMSPPEFGTPEYDIYKYEKMARTKITNRGQYGSEHLLDFGNCDKDMFNNMMVLLKSKYLSSYLVEPIVYNKRLSRIKFIQAQGIKKPQKEFSRSNVINEFKTWCYDKEYVPIGYIPWKLFELNIIVVEPEPLFLENIKDKVKEVMEIIDELKAILDLEERYDRFLILTKNLACTNGKVVVQRKKKEIKKRVMIQENIDDLVDLDLFD